MPTSKPYRGCTLSPDKPLNAAENVWRDKAESFVTEMQAVIDAMSPEQRKSLADGILRQREVLSSNPILGHPEEITL